MDSKILKALGIDPALIFLFLLVLIVILFVLYVNVTMKYNRLKSSYYDVYAWERWKDTGRKHSASPGENGKY